MVGRANRTQGTQAGHVFVTANVCMHEEVGLDYLRASEKKPNSDIAAQLGGAIVLLWKHLDDGEKRQAVEHFGGHKFQM